MVLDFAIKLFFVAVVLAIAWGVPGFHESWVMQIYVLAMCAAILFDGYVGKISQSVRAQVRKWFRRKR